MPSVFSCTLATMHHTSISPSILLPSDTTATLFPFSSLSQSPVSLSVHLESLLLPKWLLPTPVLLRDEHFLVMQQVFPLSSWRRHCLTLGSHRTPEKGNSGFFHSSGGLWWGHLLGFPLAKSLPWASGRRALFGTNLKLHLQVLIHFEKSSVTIVPKATSTPILPLISGTPGKLGTNQCCFKYLWWIIFLYSLAD